MPTALRGLEDFDDAALRKQWRRLIGKTPPEGLGRALTLRILAYHLQAKQEGDLDRASIQTLTSVHDAAVDRDVVEPAGTGGKPGAASTVFFEQLRTLRPGTILSREHGGAMHRVMVLEQGFAWEGKTYASLSEVALAISGTRWNGPRFFGLRDAKAAEDSGDSVQKGRGQ